MAAFSSDPTDAELLTMASTFDLIPYNPRGVRGSIQELRVERRRIDPEAWAIVSGAKTVLNQDGEWEYEPQPSSRDDAFFARCRWPSAREAISFAYNHLAQYPSGHKPEDMETLV